MTIAELGEFGLIAAISQQLDRGHAGTGLLVGPGDDAAVLLAPDNRVVATTDMLIEGRHFRTSWSSAADIGHKAAARNLADVAAMGAVPTALLVAFAGPGRLSVDWVLELVAGIAGECSAAGAVVAGGDTSRADLIVLAITALGDLRGASPVTRSGARPGDVVAIAGTLGNAAAGLALLAAGADATGPDADLAGRDDAGRDRDMAGLISAHQRPRPPYAAGPQAAMIGATSLIDVSDGLVGDLGHVADASGVRIELSTSRLAAEPVARADALRRAAEVLGQTDWLSWVLTGGDDHALVATFPPAVRLPGSWTPIGVVAAGDGVAVDGRTWDRPGGWDHFRS